MIFVTGYFSSLLLCVPVIAAYVVGLVVSIILINRRSDNPSFFALAGFVLLLGVQLLSATGPLVPYGLGQLGVGTTTRSALASVMGLLGNIASAAGVICLILALWLGMNGEENRTTC